MQRESIEEVYSDYIVSILTRPESRMQLTFIPATVWDNKFQSSPGPKAGCNSKELHMNENWTLFQSSPGPKAGCNREILIEVDAHKTVSILTRPESRMQLWIARWYLLPALVSILTRPESRMQRRRSPATT